MKPIELIVYDFDGTLFDTRLDIAHSVNLTLKKLGLPIRGLTEIFKLIGGGIAPLMSRALEGTGFSDTNQAIKIFREVYSEHLVKYTNFYPHCSETVDILSHKKQAIFSNKPEQFIRGILKQFNFSYPFNIIVGGDTLETRKPNPEGLFYILKKLNTSQNAALMVGDSQVDIEAGKRAGVLTCGVTYGIGGKNAVAGADYLIDTISDLQKLIELKN